MKKFTASFLTLILSTALLVPVFGNSLETKLPWLTNYRPLEVIDYSKILMAPQNKSFHYGVDRDNVPFAQNANGIKARYLNLSTDHFRLEIVEGKKVGEVEFVYLSKNETLAQFKTGAGYPLIVRTITQKGSDGATKIHLTFQYRSEKSAITVEPTSAEKGLSPKAVW